VFVLTLVAATVTYVRGVRAEQAKTLKAPTEARQVGDFQAEMLSGLDVRQMGLTLRDAFLEEAKANWRRSKLSEPEVTKREAELQSLLAGLNPTNPAINNVLTAHVPAFGLFGAKCSAAAPTPGPTQIPTPTNASCKPPCSPFDSPTSIE